MGRLVIPLKGTIDPRNIISYFDYDINVTMHAQGFLCSLSVNTHINPLKAACRHYLIFHTYNKIIVTTDILISIVRIRILILLAKTKSD